MSKVRGEGSRSRERGEGRRGDGRSVGNGEIREPSSILSDPLVNRGRREEEEEGRREEDIQEEVQQCDTKYS